MFIQAQPSPKRVRALREINGSICSWLISAGVDLFAHWIGRLRDRKAVAKVLTRIDRLALGNRGDYRVLNGGVFELRIDWGPGYCGYAARAGKVVALLLCVGDKKSQAKYIENAKTNFRDYQARSR